MTASRHAAFSGLLHTARRSLRSIGVGAVIGLLVGVGIMLATPPVARATVVLELSPISVEPNLSGGRVRSVSVDTDAQLLQSDAVVEAAARAAGRTPAQARRSLSVTAPQLTRVLRVTYTDRSAVAAQAGAQAAGSAFLAARDRLVLQPVRLALDALDRTLEVPDTAAAAESAVGSSSTVAVTTSAERQRAVNAARLALNGPGTVLASAAATAPERANPEVPLASGLATGALAGLAVAIVRHGVAQSSVAGPVMRRRPAARTGRRQRRPVLVSVGGVALLGLAVGAVGATRIDARAVGQANLVLRPLPGTAFDQRQSDNSVDLSTEAQLATSDAVLQRVVDGIGGMTSTLRRRVHAEVRPGSDVLSLSVTAPTEVRAERLARLTAQALLDVREARARAEVSRRSGQLQALVQETQVAFDASFVPPVDPGRTVVLAERLALLREELELLDRDVGAGAVADASVSGPGLATALRLALPMAGFVGGAALGLVVLRPGSGVVRWRLRSAGLVRQAARG